MLFEINSVPMLKLDPITGSLMSQIQPIAEEVVRKPRYTEPGRVSWRIQVGVSDEGSMLDTFAVTMGRKYLGRDPKRGAIAFLSVITDPETFNEYTRVQRVASYWHEEVEDTPLGIVRVPGPKLNIAHSVGTHSAVGHLTVDNVVQLPSRYMARKDALAIGPTLIGPDGVLLKSIEDPQGGDIFQAEPGVYLLPPHAVHKAADDLPRGRIFFQMDAWE